MHDLSSLDLPSIRFRLTRWVMAVSLAAGVVLATGASVLLAQLMQVPYVFQPGINLLSFVFAAGVGVLFGYFPARRAARMDPIEALRHE